MDLKIYTVGMRYTSGDCDEFSYTVAAPDPKEAAIMSVEAHLEEGSERFMRAFMDESVSVALLADPAALGQATLLAPGESETFAFAELMDLAVERRQAQAEAPTP